MIKAENNGKNQRQVLRKSPSRREPDIVFSELWWEKAVLQAPIYLFKETLIKSFDKLRTNGK
jgi:hypothetical protein